MPIVCMPWWPAPRSAGRFARDVTAQHFAGEPAAELVVRFHGGPCKMPQAALTPRERQIRDLLLSSAAHKEIAFSLHITLGTLRVSTSRVYRKLAISSRAELMASRIRYLEQEAEDRAGVAACAD